MHLRALSTMFNVLQAAVASANPLLAEKAVRDPTLFATGYKRERFYLFTRSEPEYAQFILTLTPLNNLT